jgi:1-acyl-sn-glycerol-3-phosphate acyltransferase
MLASLRGVLVTTIFTVTIIMVTIPIVFFALLRLVPVPAWQHLLNPFLDASANFWIRVNNLQQNWFLPTTLEIEGIGTLNRKEWYMLIANHQAWADILIIVRTFGTDIPGVKFFFKRSLLWVPVLGLALWGLDFPSMRRHSKAEMARDPSLRGKDLERTRSACARFRYHPVTIINFLEGTRFTCAKHQQQQSVYRHLLMPKAGGMAFALNAMDGQLHQLLDVTIYYEGGIPSYWNYVCGKVKRIKVQVRELPIPPEMLGDYEGDPEFRRAFQRWVNDMWREKDEMLDDLASHEKKIG